MEKIFMDPNLQEVLTRLLTQTIFEISTEVNSLYWHQYVYKFPMALKGEFC